MTKEDEPFISIDGTTRCSAETPWLAISSAVFESIPAAEKFIKMVLYRYPKMTVRAFKVDGEIAAVVSVSQMTTMDGAKAAANEIYQLVDEVDGRYISSVCDLAWQIDVPLKDLSRTAADD